MNWESLASLAWAVYYFIHLVYMIAVIVFIPYAMGFITWKVKGDVPGQMNQTWSQTSTLLTNAVDIVKKVNAGLATGAQPAAAAQPAEATATKKDQ